MTSSSQKQEAFDIRRMMMRMQQQQEQRNQQIQQHQQQHRQHQHHLQQRDEPDEEGTEVHPLEFQAAVNVDDDDNKGALDDHRDATECSYQLSKASCSTSFVQTRAGQWLAPAQGSHLQHMRHCL